MLPSFYVAGLMKMNVKEEMVDPLFFGESLISEYDVKYDNAQNQIDPLFVSIKNEVIKDEFESNDETFIQIPFLSENNELERQVKIEQYSSTEINLIEAIGTSESKNLNTNSAEKIHVRNVQGKRIYNKSLKIKHKLKRLLNSINQEKFLACDNCEKTFRSKSNLERHITINHRVVNSDE